jgi:hypothetical protein
VVGFGHAENSSRNVADYRKHFSGFEIELADLVASCTGCHDGVIAVVEGGCVDERRVVVAGECEGFLLDLNFFVAFFNYDFRDQLIFEGFRRNWAVPVIGAALFKFAQIPQLKDFFLAVAACEQSVSIRTEVNTLATHMGTVETLNGSLLTKIVDLDCVVPASRSYHV